MEAHLPRRPVTSLLHRLRRLTPSEIGARSAQRGIVALERAGLHPDGREPDDARFRRIIAGSSDPEALLAAFRQSRAPAFAAMDDPVGAASALRARWPDVAADLVDAARRAARGSFDLLGYRGLSFGDPIDWQLDPVSGRRAPLEHWSRVPYLDASVVGDHKLVWELSRHQHFVTLGQAYALTGEESFAESLVSQLIGWMDANPPKRGMNWASSLEVAFRAIAWTWALHLIRRSPVLTPPIYRRTLGMLHLHARHIEGFLSTYFSPNTHLTGEALGLVYLGAHFPELRGSRRWRERGEAILRAELVRQVRPDGVYFEQSTYYHRYTADFYLHLALINRGSGRGLDPALESALSGLLDHIVALARPDRRWPLLGDDDGGRLISFNSRDSNDFRDTVALGGALLERPDYCFAAGAAVPELVWLLGAGGPARFDRVGIRTPALPQAFAEGGYFVMRDGWEAEANYLVVDCGPVGGLNGGHGHADTLAVEIAAHGEPIVVDPGTFSYVGEERNAFRCSLAHSTVTVEGRSSSVPGTPFRWQNRAEAKLIRWEEGPAADYFEGLHDGYAGLDPAVTHRRAILFLRGRFWVVRDVIESVGSPAYDVRWHCAPGVAVTVGAGEARLVGPAGAGLHLAASAGAVGAEESWSSSAYGVRHRSQTCVCRVSGGGIREVITVLVPCSAAEQPEVEFLRDAVRVTTGGRTETIVLSGGPLLGIAPAGT